MAGEIGIKVEGLRGLQSSLHRYDRGLERELKGELRVVAEPVRGLAQQLANQKIRNIGPNWGRMRVGVTQRQVYVAPKTRSHGGSPRPNLAVLLLSQAMEPALDQRTPQIESELELMLDRFGTGLGF